MKKFIKVLGILFFVTFLYYLPIFFSPSLVLNRGNDLQEFFWPIFYFVKEQIFQNHEIPLWNNLFFSGTPLVSDPQTPYFYLPNIIFLLLPIETGFLFSFFIHTLISGIGTYLLTKHTFKFSRYASILSAFLYMFSPKFSGYLESGHYGLITSWAWIPFVFLSASQLIRSKKISWACLLATCLSLIFFSHLIIFVYVCVFLVIYIFTIFIISKELDKKVLLFFVFSVILTIGLTTVGLLPQLEWQNFTTRQLLLNSPEVFPIWNGRIEFLKSVFFPWNQIQTLDTEKWITLGVGPTILAFIGFMALKWKYRFALLVPAIFLLILSLNNLSPFYSMLMNTNWYVLFRVATRSWFILIIIVVVLSGFGVDNLIKKRKVLAFTLIILSLFEYSVLSFKRLHIPIPDQSKFASKEVYEYLSQDKDKFRVFCLNRCLSQKIAAQYHLELVEGYGTLQQSNYYSFSMQLAQAYWNKYTLSLPPFEIYHFQKLKPYAPVLGDFNVKYIISSYPLQSPNLIREKSFGDYIIYTNSLVKPRTYYLENDINSRPYIELHTPNKIKIITPGNKEHQLVLAEVYNSNWQVYLNGKEKVNINELWNIARVVNINKETTFVEFRFEPKVYLIGLLISTSTIILVLLLLFSQIQILRRRKKALTKSKI